MDITVNNKLFFVFDLDDTLFQEIDFLRSAYRHIAQKLAPALQKDIYEEMLVRYAKKENVFGWVIEQYREWLPKIDVNWLLKEYREHLPEIQLSNETAQFLKALHQHAIPAGLITDGRSITQRNKLKSLGIDKYFSDIIISEEFGSEKPDVRNYLYFVEKYPGKEFIFIGDNTSKDFIVPVQLGWRTICIKDCGTNIHAQELNKEPLPGKIINSFKEINLIKTNNNGPAS